MQFIKGLFTKQKLIVIGLISLVSIGALGAMGEFSGKKNGIISSLAEKVGLKKKEVPASETNPSQIRKPKAV